MGKVLFFYVKKYSTGRIVPPNFEIQVKYRVNRIHVTMLTIYYNHTVISRRSTFLNTIFPPVQFFPVKQ